MRKSLVVSSIGLVLLGGLALAQAGGEPRLNPVI